jgi:hypothetical protein
MKAIAQTCTVTLEIDRETMIVFLTAFGDASSYRMELADETKGTNVAKLHEYQARVYDQFLMRMSKYRDNVPMRFEDAVAALHKRGEIQ